MRVYVAPIWPRVKLPECDEVTVRSAPVRMPIRPRATRRRTAPEGGARAPQVPPRVKNTGAVLVIFAKHTRNSRSVHLYRRHRETDFRTHPDAGIWSTAAAAPSQIGVGDALVGQGQGSCRIDVLEVIRGRHRLGQLRIDQSDIGDGHHPILVDVTRQESDAHTARAADAPIRRRHAGQRHRYVLHVAHRCQVDDNVVATEGRRACRRHPFADRRDRAGDGLVECEHDCVRWTAPRFGRRVVYVGQ